MRRDGQPVVAPAEQVLDQDLLRALLLKAEAQDASPPRGWDAESVRLHAHHLWQTGLIAAASAHVAGGRPVLRVLAIRPAGLELLDAIRDEDLWRRVKLGLDEDLATATPLQIVLLARRLAGKG